MSQARRRCDLCESPETIEVGLFTGLYLHTPGLYPLIRCRRCGLIWRPAGADSTPADPDYAPHRPIPRRPSPARQRWKRAALANRGYPSADLTAWERCAGAFLARLLADRLAVVPPYGAGRLLDVGCGAGAYVRAMRALGWDAWGLEPVARALPAGVPGFLVGRAEALPVGDVSFSVLTLWHSLEHTDSPARALAEARRVLRPGGVIMLETPNIASAQARLFGRYWLHLDLPRHRYHFTPTTLWAYLERAGFADIRVRSSPSAIGLAGSLQALVNVATGRRGAFLRESRLADALLWPLAALEARLGRGGCLRALARRPMER